MNLQLDINKTLPDNNIFELRHQRWKEEDIIENINLMLGSLEEYGMTLVNIEIVNMDVTKSEIKKTHQKILNLTIKRGEDSYDYTYYIPWLINNRFYISGNHKIALYQLFDIPLICKKGNVIVRTNITTFYVKQKKKERLKWHINVNKRSIPFIYVCYVYMGEDRFKEYFELNDVGQHIGNWDLEHGKGLLIADVVEFATADDIDKEKLFSNNQRVSQESIVRDILLVTEIDLYSKEFMYTDNVIDEILYGFDHINDLDDTDYNKKRIRFDEQVLYSYLSEDFYNLMVIMKDGKSKYNNNSKVLLSGLNQSASAQFDFNLNPLSEISMLSKITLSGHGGFNKDQVPTNLRDIYPSMYGKVCPCDTGDRENCGTNQHLVPDIKLNDNLSFDPNQVVNNIISLAVEHVPFVSNDDATRLQMSASQQRHAIMLKHHEQAHIQSGAERLYSKYSDFIFIAEHDGQVVFRNDKNIIVKYITGDTKSYYIGYKKLYLNICDFYATYFEVGDSFNKGDIIAESNYYKNGRLQIGRNLSTAVMTWHGYNYEDGIVISDRLVTDNVFNSVHYLDLSIDVPANKILMNMSNDPDVYDPLPHIGDYLHKGDTYAIIKSLSSYIGEDIIFDTPYELKITEDCRIVDINIYANSINDKLSQYSNYIKDVISKIEKEKEDMKESMKEFLSQDEMDIFMDNIKIYQADKGRANYKIKGEKIEGLKIEITAVYERPIEVGDKIGNRHGNKGIISRIVPHDKMPLIDGKHVDVVINPLGIISRMNIGQIYELHLTKSLLDLKSHANKMLIDGKSISDVKEYILKYIDIVDDTKDGIMKTGIKKYLDAEMENDAELCIKNLYLIQPPFDSISFDNVTNAMNYTNSKFEYDCFDPISNKHTLNPVAAGSQYFIKLNHIAKDKLAKRGVGPYSSKTCQPLEGKSRKGGQRLGEMEMWAMAAHGATDNLNEFLTTKSDSIKFRNRYISKMMNNDESILNDNDDSVSQAIRLFQNSLISIGLDYDVNENEINIGDDE